MDMEMGPPPTPRPQYSLRAKTFKYRSNIAVDRPVHMFRVPISPDATLQEFCEVACQVHETNYGESISIRKCMDAEGYDVALASTCGGLFEDRATIQVELDPEPTANLRNIRDSVPPESSLRFDPTNGTRKRRREASEAHNGRPFTASDSNKRQRLLGDDPDKLLPSAERDIVANGSHGVRPRGSVVPSSQESAASTDSWQKAVPRNVSDDQRVIRETPSPSPPTESAENGTSTNTREKAALEGIQEEPDIPLSQQDLDVPIKESPKSSVKPKHILPNGGRAKSANETATERGTSVSTAATSPLSGDPFAPHPTSSLRQRASEPALKTHRPRAARANEESLYDLGSEDEEPVTLKKPAPLMKIKSSPGSGMLGMDRSKVNTPVKGVRRPSGDQVSAQLPLTPNSKERAEKQLAEKQQRKQEVAKIARDAAALAAEKRRQADEARRAEDAKLAEQRRAKEEEDRLQAQELKRKEDEKAAAVRLKSERLREGREQKEAEKKLEDKRKSDAKEREIASQRAAELAEKAKAEVAELQRKAKEEKEKLAKVALAEKANSKPAPKGSVAKSIEPSEKQRSSSPAVTRRPSVILPPRQSSTPLIPLPRKSSLRNSVTSSQAALDSSPTPAGPPSERSASNSRGPSVMEDHLSVTEQLFGKTRTPNSSNKQDAASETLTPKNAPSKLPSTRETKVKMNRPTSTPIQSSQQKSEKALKSSDNKPSSSAAQVSFSPIPVPIKATIKQSTHMSSQTTIVPPQSSATPATPSTRKPALQAANPTKSTQPVQHESTATDRTPRASAQNLNGDESSDSDSDIPARVSPQKPTPSKAIIPVPDVTTAYPEPDSDDDSEQSVRESRSPVVFQNRLDSDEVINSSFPGIPRPAVAQDQGIDEASEVEESDDEMDMDKEEAEGEESDQDGSTPHSSPQLPLHKHQVVVEKNSKAASDDSFVTQDEVDQQLTSEFFEAISAPAPRPILPPPSSQMPNHTFKVGASLSQFKVPPGAAKGRPGPNGGPKARLSATSKLLASHSSDEASESESGSSASDSESEDDKAPKTTPKPVTQRPKPASSSASDSDSDSDSSEDEAATIRKNAQAALVKMARGTPAKPTSSQIRPPTKQTPILPPQKAVPGTASKVFKKKASFAGFSSTAPN